MQNYCFSTAFFIVNKSNSTNNLNGLKSNFYSEIGYLPSRSISPIAIIFLRIITAFHLFSKKFDQIFVIHVFEMKPIPNSVVQLFRHDLEFMTLK